MATKNVMIKTKKIMKMKCPIDRLRSCRHLPENLAHAKDLNIKFSEALKKPGIQPKDCLGEAQAWHQLNFADMEPNEVSNEERDSIQNFWSKPKTLRTESPLKIWSFHKKMDEAMGNVDQTSASESMIDEIGLEF